MPLKLCLLMLFFLCSCATAIQHREHQKKPLEAKFTLAHREYGWREYDRDSVKFSRPIQYIIDFYRVTYVLNQHEVVLYKTAYQSGATPIRIGSYGMSAQQARAFRRIMRHANPDSMALRSNNVWANDGFQAEVTITKAGKVTELFWNNNYVPELVALLSIANATSPETLRIYSVGEENDLIQRLKASSDYSGYRN
jgi:hypothetical protein